MATEPTELTLLADLGARVRRLEDQEAVRATWLDYCHRLDAADFEALAEVFTDDASIEVVGLTRSLDGTYDGRRSIIEFYERADGSADGSEEASPLQTGHLSTNMQIRLDGDEATTLAYFFEIVDRLVLVGTYQHRMQRDADRWRIAHLRISVRYWALLEASHLRGRTLRQILAEPL